MTSRAYNLRVRTETGAATRPRVEVVPDGRPNQSAALTRDRLDVPVLVSNTESTPPLYSDVAASRPPSPRKEPEAIMARDTTSSRSESGALVDNNGTLPRLIETTSSFEGDAPEPEEDGGQWTTIRRRRAQSMSSLDVRNGKRNYG
jgi:hypothetical protein